MVTVPQRLCVQPAADESGKSAVAAFALQRHRRCCFERLGSGDSVQLRNGRASDEESVEGMVARVLAEGKVVG